MRKKIGCVIAYKPNHTNYGTALVGYALIKKLQQLGNQIEIINYKKKLSNSQKIKYIINLIRCGELTNTIKRFISSKFDFGNERYKKGLDERIESVENYKEKKLIPFFHDFVGFDNLKEGSKLYDCVIVGSDQVWSPLSLPNKFFNLLFVDDKVRKVAYASSFGVSEIPDFQKKETKKYLERFYKIGVREKQGKNIVESISNQKAQVVADPTLLINANEWREEIKDSKINEIEPYIFCYFLGPNKESRIAALELKKNTGYKIITLKHMDEYVTDDEQFGDEAPYDVDPNDFVKLICNAEYVCTDSFHCTAFSIQFHKKFMTFYRFSNQSKNGRNSRINSLFDTLGLNKDHIYNGDISKINSKLDWNTIESNLMRFRTESEKFLKDSLS